MPTSIPTSIPTSSSPTRLEHSQYRDQRRYRPVAVAAPDEGNRRRTENSLLFLDNLDPDAYQTDFAIEGSSNYALTLMLAPRRGTVAARLAALRANGVEFRRGTRAAATNSDSLISRLFGPDAWK